MAHVDLMCNECLVSRPAGLRVRSCISRANCVYATIRIVHKWTYDEVDHQTIGASGHIESTFSCLPFWLEGFSMVRCSNVVFFGRTFGLWLHPGPMQSTADSDSGIFEIVQGFSKIFIIFSIGFEKKHQLVCCIPLSCSAEQQTFGGPFYVFFCFWCWCFLVNALQP